MKILHESNDDIWLNKIEWKISELASQISYARVEIINYLNQIISECRNKFPKGKIIIKSEIEEYILNNIKPIELEQLMRDNYKNSRIKDKIKNSTSFGNYKI